MGFYGNITSVNKSTFQFDKRYANRYEMDQNAETDGVFVGRYVLVDYDEGASLEAIQKLIKEVGESEIDLSTIVNNVKIIPGYKEMVYIDELKTYTDSGQIYSGIPQIKDNEIDNSEVLYTADNIENNTIVLVFGAIKEKYEVVGTEETPESIAKFDVDLDIRPELYIATISGEGEEKNLIFRSITLKDDVAKDIVKNAYIINYNIDNEHAIATAGSPIGRGWDSTVWQKTVQDGTAKYVMVAELNSVVPTFDVVVDAPTVEPKAPRYDKDSTNVYYRLHVQPSWGFRVQSESDYEMINQIEIEPDVKNKALYWNKKGFNKYVPSYDDREDEIRVEPTGISGNKYWNNYYDSKPAEDIYELSMMLPAIGNSMANIWDMIFGVGKKNDSLGKLLWNKSAVMGNWDFASDSNLIRNTNFEWNTRNGERAYWKWQEVIPDDPNTPEINEAKNAIVQTYNKEALNSLAGAINSVHDLMGMIIVEPTEEEINNPAELDPSNLYYIDGKYYFKDRNYQYNNDENIGLKKDDFIDPRKADNVYYRLETFAFDNYDNIYQSNVPLEEYEYRNYYKVNENTELFEDEVYGTLEAVKVEDLNPESFDLNAETLEEPNSGLYYQVEPFGNTFPSGTAIYKRQIDGKPVSGRQYLKISATKVTEKPTFYAPDMYYLGIKTDFAAGERATWENKTSGFSIEDFNKIVLCHELTSELAKEAQHIPESSGFKFLKDVKLDPVETTYDLIDVNRTIQTISADTEGLSIIRDDADKITGITYTAFGISEKLESWEISNTEESSEITYSASAYRDTNNPPYGDGKLKALQEWVTYWNALESKPADASLKLIKVEDIQKVISRPVYTVKEASQVILTDPVNPENKLTNIFWYLDKNTDSVTTKHDLDPNKTESGKYVFLQMTTLDLINDEAKNRDWYTINPSDIEKQNPYYDLSNGYYIKDADGNFIRETATIISPSDFKNIEYYTIQNWESINKKQKTLFVPNTFYYKENNNWKLAEDLDSENDKTYYRYLNRYVNTDSNGIWDKGTIWTERASAPTGVDLKYRTFSWKLTEIPDFAKEMNTLHGLILKINQLLLAGNKLTRDRATVQGSINVLNDVINKFDKLAPADIVMIDAYGRIHGGDWDSEQIFGYNNIGRPNQSLTPAATSEDDKRWIKMTTSPGEATDFKPHIKLEHTFNPVVPTTTQSNLNADNAYVHSDSENIDEGLNNTTNGAIKDTIDLYTPIVDNMGHVVGKNTETVTLPYGFKFINVGQPISDVPTDAENPKAGDTVDELAAAGRLRADNTQDEFTINPSNKWIRIKGVDAEVEDPETHEMVPTGELITIGHEIHEINESSHGIKDFNGRTYEKLPSGTDSINIPDWGYDDAGHIIEKHDRYYILPYGFKKVGIKNTTATLSEGVWSTALDSNATEIIADNSQDIVNVETDEWINIATTDEENNDKLVFAHKYPYKEENTAFSSNLNNPLSNTINLETVVLDKVGHVKHTNVETVTLPYGFKTITGNGGSLVADSTQATAALSGDTWIQATATNEGANRGVAITHIGPDSNVTHTAINNATPNFGETFTINDWTFDSKGHKAGGGTHTVTIPTPVITGSGNVINSAELSLSGEFTLTRANIGSLQLTGYDLNNNGSSEGAILAGDTINNAFGRLEYRLNKEISDRGTAITNLDADLDAAGTAQNNGVFVVSGITEVDGILTAVDSVEVDPAGAAATEAAAALANAIGEASDASTENTIYGAKAFATGAAATAQQNAIAYVDAFQSTYTPQISNPEHESDPEAPETIDDPNATITITLTGLAKEFFDLKAQIAALKARVAALESTEEPEPEPSGE